MKSSWLVLAAALVFGLLLAIVYVNWQPRIEENERLKHELEECRKLREKVGGGRK